MTCNPDSIAASNSSGVDCLRYTEGATSLEGSLPSQSVLFVDTGGTRTHDDLNANQEFYQLNYWPIKLSCFRSNSRLTTGASRFDL